MNRFAKITSLFFACAIIASSCKDGGDVSPYDEILNQPPYAAISDSIRKETGNDELFFRRAVLLNTNNFPEPALADFRKAWSLKKDERYAYAIGNLWLEKKPDSAVYFLKNALEDLPESILLRISLGRAYDAQGNTDEALKICNEILQLKPDQADVMIFQSDLLERKGNLPEAIQLLEKARNLVPNDPELNFNLAFKYAENKNPKVIALCDSLARADKEGIQAEPYYYKGIYFSNIGDKSKAIEQFNEAIRHDYYFLNAYIEKGRVFYDQKKFEEAYKVFNLAMSISPKFADAYYWMGRSQEVLGAKEEARLNYQRAYGLDKSFTEAKEAADRVGK